MHLHYVSVSEIVMYTAMYIQYDKISNNNLLLLRTQCPGNRSKLDRHIKNYIQNEYSVSDACNLY